MFVTFILALLGITCHALPGISPSIQDYRTGLSSLDGLPSGPLARQKRSISDSASMFLREIYSQVAAESNANSNKKPSFEISSSERRMAKESNTISSFTSKDNPQQLNPPPDNSLWFDVGSIPSSDREITARLRIYYNPETSTSQQPFTVNVQQVMKGESGVSSLRLLGKLPVAVGESGWLVFDVTTTVEVWTEKPAKNLGLRVQVFADDGSEIRMNDAGVVGSSGRQAQMPFLTVYVKHDNTAMAGMIASRLNSAVSRRSKRSTRRFTRSISSGTSNRKTRNDCRREEMKINFADIGWNDWIYQPKSYSAFYCTGTCQFPLTKNVNATNHAVIQALMHLQEEDQYPNPQCAPNKMNEMLLLYYNGSQLVMGKFQDMVVLSCGCQ